MPGEAGPAKLGRRQRECLALVYQRKTSKEIARLLGIERSTVDNYIADAVQTMDAPNRRVAAEWLMQDEEGSAPSKVEGQSARIDPGPSDPAPPLPPPASTAWSRLPLRPQGAAHNDLGTLARLGFVFALAFAVAVGFGMLAVGLHVAGDILNQFARAGR